MVLWVFFYRLSSGKIGGTMRGAPVLLLTTTGRKTGKKRTTPLLYVFDGPNNVVVVASNGGHQKNPQWFFNLKRNPDAEILVKKDFSKVRAKEASPEERARLWPVLTKTYSAYDDYQRKTSREIPVMILERRD